MIFAPCGLKLAGDRRTGKRVPGFYAEALQPGCAGRSLELFQPVLQHRETAEGLRDVRTRAFRGQCQTVSKGLFHS
jgi:hypothetical protein